MITCVAYHLPPAGAEILRRFNSSAAFLADMSASSPSGKAPRRKGNGFEHEVARLLQGGHWPCHSRQYVSATCPLSTGTCALKIIRKPLMRCGIFGVLTALAVAMIIAAGEGSIKPSC